MPNQLIPHLFRTEFSKLTAVLCARFGLQNLQLAEDIVSDTFLLAAETWGKKGVPENQIAWLYTVAKNKATDHLRREQLFQQKIAPNIKADTIETFAPVFDFSTAHIQDSKLCMLFAVCHQAIPEEAQIGLALRILCGFGIGEIAAAFLSNKETINKRLYRAKEKLRQANPTFELPAVDKLSERLKQVLKVIYLLFNEGYHASVEDQTLRREFCLEAMRLAQLLRANEITSQPAVDALLALMCFHASRFAAREDTSAGLVLYHDQRRSLWDRELIAQGNYFINCAARGEELTTYHLEAAIAYWHTKTDEHPEKWSAILKNYNLLLQIEYSPVAALNRTYAYAKVHGRQAAIKEALQIRLDRYHLYHALLGSLYDGVDNGKAKAAWERALKLAPSDKDKLVIEQRLKQYS